MLEKRRQIADIYNEAFKDLPEIKTPYVAVDHAWHLYVIRLDSKKLKIDRKTFIEELKARGIGTSVHFIPLHIHPFYRDTYHYQPNDYPVSLRVYKQIVSLPVYSKMSVHDAYRVADAVKEVIEKNRAS
jgi:dTDP-4-amino-4,6-dideoxygalactose transaminase